VGSTVEAIGTSKSAVSRRLIKGLERALEKLLSRPLDRLDLLALVIDGVVVAEHTAVVALGIDSDGNKHVLGLWEGATENAVLCRSLLSDLVARGLRYERGILVVIDGSKALRAAVRDIFGEKAVVQRCQVHKKRNVLEHLPKSKQARVKRKLSTAWRENDPARAKQKLLRLAEALEKDHP
jgi:transposase-like protein